MSFIKKYKKDLLITIAVLLAIFTAVMGWHFTETSDTPFWQNAWVIIAIVALLACVGGWLYLNSKKGDD